MEKDGSILRGRSDGYQCKIGLRSLKTLTLLFIMILSLGREPWRLVKYQCGTNLVPLQDIFVYLLEKKDEGMIYKIIIRKRE